MAAVDLLVAPKGSHGTVEPKGSHGTVEAFRQGPPAPHVPCDEQSLSLAKGYEIKYPCSPSSVHLEWLVFFDHEIMRQAARSETVSERADASRKFAQLYHVRRAAVRLLEEAYVREALHA